MTTPCHSQPWGKQTSAPAATPRVPTSVTTSGLIPSLMNRLMNGSRALPCQKALNRSSMSAQTLSGPRRCLTASRSWAILLTVLGVPTRDRVAERRAATRQEIVSAAWALAEEHGLHGFTLRDLATRVGMRAPSLYSHVDSKLALYDAMYEDAWLDFEQRAEARLADLGEGP